MEEGQIAEQLKQNVSLPEPVVQPPSAPEAPPPRTDDTQPAELDELTIFKMHDYFGEQYKGSNTDNKARLEFIFNNVAQQVGTRDYLAVLSRVNELERMIGTAHSENRIMRLHQWIGLDRIRRNTETAMRLINA